MNEEWRQIEGFKHYQVSNLGRVRSFSVMKRGKLMKKCYSHRGYVRITLHNGTRASSKSCFVHRLVATAFIPTIEGKPFINHKNLIKDDNRADNLEWVTQKENDAHSRFNGATPPAPRGAANGMARSVKCIELNKVFGCASDAARWAKIPVQNIIRCCKGGRPTAAGYTWRYY